LRVFSSVPDAADALTETDRDIVRASREARELAHEVFSTRVVLPRLMALCGL
jgi:hypothetical protein